MNAKAASVLIVVCAIFIGGCPVPDDIYELRQQLVSYTGDYSLVGQNIDGTPNYNVDAGADFYINAGMNALCDLAPELARFSKKYLTLAAGQYWGQIPRLMQATRCEVIATDGAVTPLDGPGVMKLSEFEEEYGRLESTTPGQPTNWFYCPDGYLQHPFVYWDGDFDGLALHRVVATMVPLELVQDTIEYETSTDGWFTWSWLDLMGVPDVWEVSGTSLMKTADSPSKFPNMITFTFACANHPELPKYKTDARGKIVFEADLVITSGDLEVGAGVAIADWTIDYFNPTIGPLRVITETGAYHLREEFDVEDIPVDGEILSYLVGFDINTTAIFEMTNAKVWWLDANTQTATLLFGPKPDVQYSLGVDCSLYHEPLSNDNITNALLEQNHGLLVLFMGCAEWERARRNKAGVQYWMGEVNGKLDIRRAGRNATEIEGPPDDWVMND